MGGGSDVKPLRWYRGQGRWANLGLVVFCALLAVGCFVVAGVSGNLAAAGFGIVFALAGPFFIGGFRAGIGAEDDGVLVRRSNFRGEWVPWADLSRFEAVAKRGSRGGTIYQVAVSGSRL